MPMDLSLVKTLVIVIMENRSFDHLLGYLSLEGYPVDGLRADGEWLMNAANPFNGYLYRPFEYIYSRLPVDPPHERNDVASQIGADRGYDMKGFVSCYAKVARVDPATPPPVMGYYTKGELPVIDMFARQYAVCDRWFAPLPTGTQPNRLMAMSGMSRIDKNVHILSFQPLVYEWLEQRGVRWRVYHEGTPFFFLMPQWVPEVLFGNHFRPFRDLPDDVQTERDAEWPDVIFIEPKYGDDPTRVGEASDHHPPGSILRGQEFLAEVYVALTSNPKRWANMVLIVTYDEHGGFFDHVPPEKVVTSGQGRYPDFQTTGARVPGLVISPLVQAGRVFHERLDHTSILKLIAEKFAPGEGYSAEVNGREVRSVAEVLDLDVPRADVPKIPAVPSESGPVPINTLAFQTAAVGMSKEYPDQTKRWFPEVWHANASDGSQAP